MGVAFGRVHTKIKIFARTKKPCGKKTAQAALRQERMRKITMESKEVVANNCPAFLRIQKPVKSQKDMRQWAGRPVPLLFLKKRRGLFEVLWNVLFFFDRAVFLMHEKRAVKFLAWQPHHYSCVSRIAAPSKKVKKGYVPQIRRHTVRKTIKPADVHSKRNGQEAAARTDGSGKILSDTCIFHGLLYNKHARANLS